MLNKGIKKYLDEFDKRLLPIDTGNGEFEIANRIKQIIEKENKNYKRTNEDIAEEIAFDFLPGYPNVKSEWGTYYGPKFILPDQSGQMKEYPSIQKVTEHMLNYWQDRANIVTNPILKSRYADLVVDFYPTVVKKNAHYALFSLVIDSNIDICKKLLMYPLDCKKKIKRALDLCLKSNNVEKLELTIEAIIDLENKIAEDSKLGLWGFSFKWSLLDYKNKINITPEAENKIVGNLEERLKRVKKDLWAVEHAVSLLADYYANERDEKNLMRVLGVLEESFKQNKRMNSDALLKIHSIGRVHEIYKKYRDKGFEDARLATNRISHEISQLELDWHKSLKKIETKIEVKNEDIDKFLNTIFGEKNGFPLETVLSYIASRFLPQKKKIKNLLENIFEKYPIQFLCTKHIISTEGFPIANLPPLKEDYENNFKNYANQYIQFNSALLAITIDELKKRFKDNQIKDYFNNSLIFQKENKEYVNFALQEYWNDNFLVSSHLFIPLIESAIREIVRLCGGNVLKINELGGYDFLPLNLLLEKNQDIFEKIFEKIGNDITFYFKIVLTDKLGMNLRNNFAHGLEKKTFFSQNTSDRLFHILLLLSLIKEKNDNLESKK